MKNIFKAIVIERSFQEAKRPNRNHSVGAWLTIMRSELREAEEAWCHCNGDTEALKEILQVITTGIACLQQHGVYDRDYK